MPSSRLQTYKVNGAELAVYESGSGDPIVFVHGSLGDYRTWGAIQRRLRGDFRTISYSRRYNYPNATRWTQKDYSPLLDAEDLLELLIQLSVQKAVIVASSFGGTAALHAALLDPSRISGLVLVEPALRGWLKDLANGEKLTDEFFDHAWHPAKLAFDAGDDERAIGLLLDGFNGPGTFAAFTPPMRRALMQNSWEMRLALQQEPNVSYLSRSSIRTLTLPTLVVCGENSPHMYRLIAEELLAQLDQARMTTVPNARHTVWLDQPDHFEQLIRTFARR
ncbi:MAG: alpha/beta hydrolase [Chthonomonadales bacterium]